MLVQSYLQTISNDPFSQLHCFSCQATLTVSFFTHSNHPVNFHLSQCIQHELLLLDDKQRVKTYNLSFWNSRVQYKYFCIKFISYVQNVYHRPRRIIHSEIWLIDRCLRQVIPDMLQCIFQLRNGLGIWVKFVKCLRHCTPHMIAKWVEVWWIWWSFILGDEVGIQWKVKSRWVVAVNMTYLCQI